MITQFGQHKDVDHDWFNAFIIQLVTRYEDTRNVRYLGVHLDTEANFKAYAESVAKRADELTSSLKRIMPNTGDSKQRARKLLTTVPHAVLIYGAPL